MTEKHVIDFYAKNKLPHNAVHLQGIEPACAGGCLTASRKSPLEGGWFLKGATSGSLSKFVGSAQRKMYRTSQGNFLKCISFSVSGLRFVKSKFLNNLKALTPIL